MHSVRLPSTQPSRWHACRPLTSAIRQFLGSLPVEPYRLLKVTFRHPAFLGRHIITRLADSIVHAIPPHMMFKRMSKKRRHPEEMKFTLLKRVEKLILLFACAIIVFITALWLVNALAGRKEEVSALNYSQAPPTNLPLVAIVACIKSGIYSPASFLEQSLLPSIYETITNKERALYRVELILGYDDDDEYWQNHDHQLRPKSYYGEPMYVDREPIPINFVSIRKDPNGDRPNRIPFNELCQAAYDYGATYIARINDDSEFKTKGWITVAKKALERFAPPNIGVVGPTCHQGNTDIMTHDFVHAPSHYSIFDTYYPPVFDNYYVDDWITRVYGEERTRKLKSWEVEHHLYQFSTRYEATFSHQWLNQTVKEGRDKVTRAILNVVRIGERKKDQGDKLRVLGTETIEQVDGPMNKVHLSFMKK